MNPEVMSVLLFVTLGFFSWSMLRRVLPLFTMQPEVRWDQPFVRAAGVIKFALGQSRFFHRFELLHGLAHVMIFWGFIAVSINTIHLVGRGFIAGWSLPGFQDTAIGLIYAPLKDLFVLAVMIGTLVALGRRVFLKPERMTLSWEANLILLWIFFMMVLDILYSGTMFLMLPDSPEKRTAFMGVLGMNILTGLGLTGESHATVSLNAIGLWGHLVMVFAFLNYLPYGKHFHVIMSLPGVFAGSLKAKGELTRQDFQSEDLLLGVGKIEELPWKRALDMYNCTECGRCQANCPAYLSDKPLSPKVLLMDSRDHLKKKTPLMCRAAYYKLKDQPERAQEVLNSWNGEMLTGEVIKEDTIWSCTTCGHCIENCPLLIEHVEHIIDMRRYLMQEESRFPKELTAVYKGWENMSNPWSLASNSRADWFEDMGVKSPSENHDFEYLYYVGCAGSFDDRNKTVSIALLRLMKKAEVNFVCLGNDEKCCGETARRLGNEFLSQSMMEANVKLWNDMGVKKIITACPHCYNTIKNEYKQFGGNYEVMHHTEIIERLIRERKLEPTLNFDRNGAVVYHDSCYLGRYNELYDTPRQLVKSIPGVDLVEAERCRRISFCCGAGGGRMWVEENIGRRISNIRCDQLLETSAETFATACPYCKIMLDDEIRDKGLEDRIKVLDVAQIVNESITD